MSTINEALRALNRLNEDDNQDNLIHIRPFLQNLFNKRTEDEKSWGNDNLFKIVQDWIWKGPDPKHRIRLDSYGNKTHPVFSDGYRYMMFTELSSGTRFLSIIIYFSTETKDLTSLKVNARICTYSPPPAMGADSKLNIIESAESDNIIIEPALKFHNQYQLSSDEAAKFNDIVVPCMIEGLEQVRPLIEEFANKKSQGYIYDRIENFQRIKTVEELINLADKYPECYFYQKSIFTYIDFGDKKYNTLDVIQKYSKTNIKDNPKLLSFTLKGYKWYYVFKNELYLIFDGDQIVSGWN